MSTSFFSQLFATTPPSVAVEVTAKQVSVIGISTQGGTRAVTAHAVQPLPAGLVTPALNGVNVHESAALAAVVKAAADAISPRPRRVALILPDSVAKVSILRFDKIPAKEQELDQLIKWQMRKAAPFRIEDGQVSWAESAAIPGGGREYLVVLARRDLIESYEHACVAAGLEPGIVDIVSLNLINAVVALEPAAMGLNLGDGLHGLALLVHFAALVARQLALSEVGLDDDELVHLGPRVLDREVDRTGRPGRGRRRDLPLA